MITKEQLDKNIEGLSHLLNDLDQEHFLGVSLKDMTKLRKARKVIIHLSGELEFKTSGHY